MHKKYNKKEIEKNLNLFESSLNEVFAKLMLNHSNEILYQRAKTTLELAEHVKDSLKKYKDAYIKKVMSIIELYQLRFERIKTKILKHYTTSIR
jgi:hypothetical protein